MSLVKGLIPPLKQALRVMMLFIASLFTDFPYFGFQLNLPCQFRSNSPTELDPNFYPFFFRGQIPYPPPFPNATNNTQGYSRRRRVYLHSRSQNKKVQTPSPSFSAESKSVSTCTHNQVGTQTDPIPQRKMQSKVVPVTGAHSRQEARERSPPPPPVKPKSRPISDRLDLTSQKRHRSPSRPPRRSHKSHVRDRLGQPNKK